MAHRTDYEEEDGSWGQYVFEGAEESRTPSIFHNQNLHRPPKRQRCHIRLGVGHNVTNISTVDGLTLFFDIEGGSDAPRLILRLIIGPASNPTYDIQAIFMPWSLEGTDTRRSVVDINRDNPATQTFTFSSRLRNLAWSYPVIPEDRLAALSHLFAKSAPVQISWMYQNPICWGFEAPIPPLTPRQAEMVNSFKMLRHGSSIAVLTKSSKKMIAHYNFFVAQPVPTPPHMWRWATKQTRNNESTINKFPDMDLNGPLAAMFRRRTGNWIKQPPGFAVPSAAVSMPAPIRYLDEREYDVFKTGDVLRDVQYEEMTSTGASFNGKYDFDFQPLVTGEVASDRSYVVVLQVRSTSGACIPPLEANTHVNLNVQLGAKDTAKVSFSGKVISSPVDSDEYTVTMVLTRTGGGTGFVLHGHNGVFRFGSQGTAFRQIARSIGQVMHGGAGVDIDNWAKTLLLAHNPVKRPSMPPRNPHAERYLAGISMVPKQAEVFLNATDFGDAIHQRITICQGPPGTGKSELILRVAHYCLRRRIVFAVTAASNSAVKVNADRLRILLQDLKEDTSGIYHLRVDVLESIHSSPDLHKRADEYIVDDDELVSESALWSISDSNIEINPATFAGLQAFLDTQLTHSDADKFSLVRHILDRLETTVSRPAGWRPTNKYQARENYLLRCLLSIKVRAENWIPANTSGTENEDLNPVKNFDSCWLVVQKFYLEHARGIFATASTLGSRAAHVVPVRTVLIDDAAQIKEVDSLNAFVRHLAYGKLQKLSLFGDHFQLPPTVLAKYVSEFAKSTELSLMHRLVLAGYDYTMLTEQYRMHPDIASIVGKLFYGNALTTNQSALSRPNARLFREWAYFDRFPHTTQALFLSIDDPVQLFREVGGFSLVNTAYIHVVVRLVIKMTTFGIPSDDILVITFYAAQKRCYDRLFKSGGRNTRVILEPEVNSVDGSQGRQAPFVILDMVTPGGSKYALGFLKDLKRLCVALSRAQDGLILVGHRHMASSNYASQPIKAWTDVINQIKEANGLWSGTFGSDQKIRTLLKIPGPGYELAPTRSDAQGADDG